VLFRSATSAMSGFANTSEELEETVSNSSLAGSFLAARVAVRDNDDRAAVAFYKRAQALDPEDADLKRNLFVSLMANGRIEEALEIANTIDGGGNPENLARIVQAIEAIRKRSWTKVPQSMEGLKGTDLDQLSADLIRSWALFGAGDLDAALEAAETIAGPDWVILVRNYHSGLMAAANGAHKKAIAKFGEVIEKRQLAPVLTETYSRAIEALVRTHIRAGDKDKALEALNVGISLLPSHRAYTLLKKSIDDDKTVTPLITSSQEGVAELFFNIASAIGRDGGMPFAKTYLQIANHLNGESDVIAYGLGDIFERQKRYDEANAHLSTIPESSPIYRRAAIATALNLNQMEKSAEAISGLKELIKKDPKDLNGYMTLGGLFSQKEKYKEAAEIYDEAVLQIGEPKSFHWNLFFRRGISRERQMQWDLAEPNFKKALELFPDQPDVLNYLGYSWIDMGIHLDDGLDMIRKAVKQQPRSGFIIDSLGWAYYKLGKFADAVRELEKAIQIMPQDATLNDHLGDAYWRTGRKLEATFQWKHALTAKPVPVEITKIEKKLKVGLPKEIGSSN